MAAKWFLKLKRRLGFPIAPHDRAIIGEGSWGRTEAKAKGRATIKARVYRAATDTWEEVN